MQELGPQIVNEKLVKKMNFTVQAKVNFGVLNRTNRLKCVFRHYEETLQKVVHFLLKCTEQVRIFKNGFK